MQTRFTRAAFGFVLAVLVVAAVATPAAAQGPPKDQLTVLAHTSLNGVEPRASGPQWHYEYCFASPTRFSDTFPVDYTLTNSDGVGGENVTVSFNAVGSGQLAGGTSGLGNLSLADDGSTVERQFVVNSGGVLPEGEYNLNIHMSAPPLEAQLSHNTIHIHVVIGPECESGPKCFFTDGDFVFLRDCAGNSVTTSSGGTFTIQTRGGRGGPFINNTRPRNIFYNLLWENTTGSGQLLTITLSGSEVVVPVGGGACHALAFASGELDLNNIGGLSPSNFALVNTTGQNCTSGHQESILVGDGEVVWVTWHLNYEDINAVATGIVNTCPGNVSISATGSLTGSSVGVSCTATATGYISE